MPTAMLLLLLGYQVLANQARRDRVRADPRPFRTRDVVRQADVAPQKQDVDQRQEGARSVRVLQEDEPAGPGRHLRCWVR